MTPKVILLTGASSGIGFDTARMLARQGHKVYGAARRIEKIEPLAPLGVVAIKMDVTDQASMEAGVQQVIAAEGHIDVLINNAANNPKVEDASKNLGPIRFHNFPVDIKIISQIHIKFIMHLFSKINLWMIPFQKNSKSCNMIDMSMS